MSDQIHLGDAIWLDDLHAVKKREPLYLPRRLFGHMHLRGMTGAGKSSLGICQLVDQFADPYAENNESVADAQFVIDFGGDQNVFWNASETALRTNRRFRFLTLDNELESFCFPPFQAIPRSGANVIRVSQMLIRSFHMEHGLVYGGNYFSQQNLAALLRVAKKLSKENKDATLEDIARYLEDPKNRRQFKDADQVRMTFDFLLEYPQLRRHLDPEQNIDVYRALDPAAPPELIYFFCPTLEEPLTAPLVGGLALCTIIAVAIARKKHGLPSRTVRIFVDEFQEIIGRSLAALLAQSRKFNLSLFLANQSTSQLQNRDLSLADAVFEGCQVRQYYTVCGEDDTRVLQSLSKDKIKTLGGGAARGLQTSQNFRETIVPSLERDQTLEVSSRFGHSYLVVNDGAGYRAPIILEQTHRFPDYSKKPMPLRAAAEIVNNHAVAAPAVPPVLTPAAARWQTELAALWTDKQAAEAWEMVG